MRKITLVLVAAAFAGAACTVHNDSIPPVAVPSEAATVLRLTATPNSVPQDGVTPSRIVIESFNATGQPIPSLAVQLALEGQGKLSASTATTGADGKAAVFFVAPAQSGPSLFTTVHAIASGAAVDFQVSIKLVGDVAPPPVVPNSPPPTADFTFSPTKPVVGQDLFLNGSNSKAVPGHSIVKYTWDFGDGPGNIDSTGGVTPPGHKYSAPGTYTITLTVTDDANATGTKTTTVDVGSGNPVAVISFSPSTGVHPVLIAFSSGGSTLSNGATVTTYAWDFGDPGSGASNTSAVSSPSHNYANAGTYVVRLTITDSLGRVGTVTVSITVT